MFTIPIVYPVFMLWYFSSYNHDSLWQINIYNGYFEVLSIFLPFLISLITGLFSFQEERAGGFYNLLVSSVSRKKLYLGKLSLTTFFIIVDLVISTILILLGMKYILHVEKIQYELFMQGVLLTLIGSLILITLHLFTSFAIGMGTSIAIGGIGFLISAIIGATVLGDKIWPFVPWAWPVRLSQLPMLKMPEIRDNFGLQMSELYIQELIKGLLPAIVIFLIVTIISVFWFNRWEGKQSYE